ncbi:hypothetical protein DFJ73DRAFT_859488 [Zopfochytrium polystomum]|nr:hypothetical protein DFJ73DRAFT_859488 [Zopfochytrium polystomum]
MVPFFTVLLILPEALPFLIVSRPDFVPSTCLSSNQIEKMWTGSKEKRLEIAAGFVKSCADGGNFRPEQFGTNDFVRMVAQYQPQHFDWSHLPLDTLRNCSTWVGLKRGSRLVPHFDFLGKEDALMKAEGLDAMTDGELRVAAEARGISTIGKDSEAIKVELETWLALTVDPEVKMPGGLMIIASAIRTGMSGSIVERL